MLLHQWYKMYIIFSLKCWHGCHEKERKKKWIHYFLLQWNFQPEALIQSLVVKICIYNPFLCNAGVEAPWFICIKKKSCTLQIIKLFYVIMNVCLCRRYSQGWSTWTATWSRFNRRVGMGKRATRRMISPPQRAQTPRRTHSPCHQPHPCLS